MLMLTFGVNVTLEINVFLSSVSAIVNVDARYEYTLIVERLYRE